MLEIAQPPFHLGHSVTAIRQRQDHVVVGLGNRGAVSGESLDTATVCLAQCLINFGRFALQPRKQRRTKIEACVRVVFPQLDDPLLAIQNSGQSVRSVAFGSDSFVPIVVWISGILELYGFERRILARWLIEMRVDTDVAHGYSEEERARAKTASECDGIVISVFAPASTTVGAEAPGPSHSSSAESIRFSQVPE